MKSRILDIASKGKDEEAEEPEVEEEDEGKQAFLDMAKAIRDGKDEEAFALFKDCMELC